MKYRVITFALYLFVFLTSCTKEEQLPVITNFQRKVVVDAIFRPDLPIVVFLQSNMPIDKEFNDCIWITDANIMLYEDTTAIGKLNHTSNGMYKIEYKPQINRKYKIEIIAEGYPKAEGEVFMPSPDTINISYNEIIEQNILYTNIHLRAHFDRYYYCYAFGYINNYYEYGTEKKELISLNYYLPNHPSIEFFNSKNCYGIELGHYLTLDIFNSYSNIENPYYKLYVPGTEDVYLASVTFFSNKTFKGQQSVITVEKNNYYGTKDTLLLFRVSEELYQFLNTVAANEKTTRIGRFEGFANTIAVVSNIKNGYGCIGAIVPCYLIIEP
ncbi:MAG: DUF4249 domain-containing protein [Bacteroidales bacterium]|nr:DUF4249 domain-containing protein [Bacteroidales bacterium]